MQNIFPSIRKRLTVVEGILLKENQNSLKAKHLYSIVYIYTRGFFIKIRTGLVLVLVLYRACMVAQSSTYTLPEVYKGLLRSGPRGRQSVLVRGTGNNDKPPSSPIAKFADSNWHPRRSGGGGGGRARAAAAAGEATRRCQGRIAARGTYKVASDARST